MNLVEVDDLHVEAPQAVLEFAADGVRAQAYRARFPFHPKAGRTW